MQKEEIVENVKSNVEQGKGGFIPFNAMDGDLVILLKRANYAIKADPEQEMYWYKPNRPGAAKAKAKANN